MPGSMENGQMIQATTATVLSERAQCKTAELVRVSTWEALWRKPSYRRYLVHWAGHVSPLVKSFWGSSGQKFWPVPWIWATESLDSQAVRIIRWSWDISGIEVWRGGVKNLSTVRLSGWWKKLGQGQRNSIDRKEGSKLEREEWIGSIEQQGRGLENMQEGGNHYWKTKVKGRNRGQLSVCPVSPKAG